MAKYRDSPWLILFGGAGRERVIEALVNNGIEVAKVVVPKRQSLRLRDSISFLKRYSLHIEEVTRSDLADKLVPDADCVLLSVGFPYVIPRDVYSRFKGAWNIHPTLLPRYRGPTSGAYVLINNEEYSGSTVHLMDDEVDKGPIIAQKKVRLSPFDTIRSMQRKVYGIEPGLILEAIKKIDEGGMPLPQDERMASSYPNVRTPDDSELDPTKTLLELVNYIRACDERDYPAFFYYHGQKVYIRLWRAIKPVGEDDTL